MSSIKAEDDLPDGYLRRRTEYQVMPDDDSGITFLESESEMMSLLRCYAAHGIGGRVIIADRIERIDDAGEHKWDIDDDTVEERAWKPSAKLAMVMATGVPVWRL